MRAEFGDNLYRHVDGHADQYDIGDGGGLARRQVGLHVRNHYGVAEISEHLGEAAAHRPGSADDGDRARFEIKRDFRSQRRLSITTGPQHEAEQTLDHVGAQAQRFGPVASIGDYFALALAIADGHAVRSLIGGDLAHQSVAPGQKLEQLVIDGIDQSAQHGQRSAQGGLVRVRLRYRHASARSLGFAVARRYHLTRGRRFEGRQNKG